MPEKSIQTNIRIARFDPSKDEQPRFETFEVPAAEGWSVLSALDYIYEHLDPSLAYYDHAACAQGICGRCAVSINGRVALMCETLVEGDLTLEVPPHSSAVKDLVYTRREKKG